MIRLFIWKDLLSRVKRNLLWWRRIKFPIGKKVYFIGTPEYSNLGDSAIAIVQMLFLEKCGFKKDHIKEYTQSEYTDNFTYFIRYLGKRHLICGIGGGNMGNLWYNEELFRYTIIDSFPNNPIIIFPQTIFFTNDSNGEIARRNSISHYNNHRKLTLVAREKNSFDLMNQLYKAPCILFVPDIVLSLKAEDYGVTYGDRSGALLVFREDSEKAMSDHDRSTIKNYLKDNSIYFYQTDMYSDIPVTKENRQILVRNKMQEFADSKIVITDRLHGMIFAAITGTPCIVFGNNHYKVNATYDLISYLPYIKYVNTAEEALQELPSIIKMGKPFFLNSIIRTRFDELKNHCKSIM